MRFRYGRTVLQLQLKSDPAKFGSDRILGVGDPIPVSGRNSIFAHPYCIHNIRNNVLSVVTYALQLSRADKARLTDFCRQLLGEVLFPHIAMEELISAAVKNYFVK